jgi:uncharacterized C2H2 Zn-finger protein
LIADQSDFDSEARGATAGEENPDDYADPVEEEAIRTYRCRACGATFSSRRELEMHWNRAHSSWRRKKRRRRSLTPPRPEGRGLPFYYRLLSTPERRSMASLRFSMLFA